MNPDDVERTNSVSKVPEKDKTFHPSSSVKAFDKDTTLEKIRAIQIFYDEVSAFAVKITDEGVNCEDLRRKISLLKKTLTHVYEAIKREEQETSNNSISNMHKSFIKEREKLDSIVKDVENAALSEMLTVAHNGWRKAVSETAALKETLQDFSKNYSETSNKYHDLCEKYDTLRSENNTFAEKYDALKSENATISEKYDAFESKYITLSEKYDALKSESTTLSEKCDTFESKYNTIKEKLVELQGVNKKTAERQDALLATNVQLGQKMDEIMNSLRRCID